MFLLHHCFSNKKAIWTLGPIILGNNHYSPTFQSIIWHYFMNDCILKFLKFFFLFYEAQFNIFGIGNFLTILYLCSHLDLTRLMWFNRMKADHFLCIECLKDIPPFCEVIFFLSNTSISCALDKIIKTSAL